MKITLFVFLFASFSTLAYYGQDNRKDYYELSSDWKKVSKAIAYQVDKHELRGFTFARYWKTLNEPLYAKGVCASDRFGKEPSMMGNCTGILVSPKHLLTAGNCLIEQYCKNDLYYWLFNYHREDVGEFSHKRARKDFYQCKKIVDRVYCPEEGISYVLLELKKTVKGVTPLKIGRTTELDPKTELITMGHIKGTPLKISGGAFSLNEIQTHFWLNSDIKGESEGSAVINSKTKELVGMLVAGSKNYSYQGNSCQTPWVLDNDDAQEIALKTNFVLDLLESLD